MVLTTPPQPHWVLLRGLTREAAHWGDFPAVFRQMHPAAELHLLDLPGNGVRHTERSPTTVADLVADVRAQLQQRAIPTPLHVLALSLGAMVAVEWAHTAPHELAGLVLVNTSLRPFSPLHHRLRPRQWMPLLGLALGGLSAEAAERRIWRMTSRQRTVDPARLDAWVAARLAHPVRGSNALRQLLAAACYRAPAQAPAVPMRLLVGSGDELVDPRCSRALERVWNMPLVEHPHAGHDLPLDDPVWVARQAAEQLLHTH